MCGGTTGSGSLSFDPFHLLKTPKMAMFLKGEFYRNFKIWVSSEWKSASEPLFDLQEALGMTSNMAIFAVFRRRNGSKLKLPDPVVPPHLGVPNFFWCFWNIFMAISNGQNRDTPVSPFCPLKVTVVFTNHLSDILTLKISISIYSHCLLLCLYIYLTIPYLTESMLVRVFLKKLSK